MPKPKFLQNTCKINVHFSVAKKIFLVFIEFTASKAKNCGVAIDEPPRDSANGAVDHSCNHPLCYTLPVFYKFFKAVI